MCCRLLCVRVVNRSSVPMGRSSSVSRLKPLSHKTRIIENASGAWPCRLWVQKRHPVASQGCRLARVRQTFVRRDRQRTRSALAVFRAVWRGVLRVSDLPVGQKRPRAPKPVQPSLQKESASRKTQIRFTNLAIPFRERGVGHRHERWDGMRWTRQRRARRNGHRAGFTPVSDQRRADERRCFCFHQRFGGRAHTLRPLGEDGSRTVKPCGPGTRCWCQVGGGFANPTGFRTAVNSPTTVTKTNSSPGRARSKPLKPLRRECRMIPVNLWRRPCAFFCTRAAGASDTRHSLRPLF